MDKIIKITKQIGIKTAGESNIFLRKLWSNFDECLAKKGKKNGWQYAPFEMGDGSIRIGSCNLAEAFVKLGDNGGIDSITFRCDSNDKSEIISCLDATLDDGRESKPFWCEFVCELPKSMMIKSASMDKVCIYSEHAGSAKVCINIKAYGRNDATLIASTLRPYVIALLFVYYKTNVSVVNVKLHPESFRREFQNQAVLHQHEWYDEDDMPKDTGGFIVQGQLLMALNHLEEQVWNRADEIYPILNSARNICLAQDLLNEYEYKSMKFSTDYSILLGQINGMIMSALEGLATRNLKQERCEKCGQPIYSISKAVRDYMSVNFNEVVSSQAINLYNKRSQLFHKNRISLYEYSGVSWPLLVTFKQDKEDDYKVS